MSNHIGIDEDYLREVAICRRILGMSTAVLIPPFTADHLGGMVAGFRATTSVVKAHIHREGET